MLYICKVVNNIYYLRLSPKTYFDISQKTLEDEPSTVAGRNCHTSTPMSADIETALSKDTNASLHGKSNVTWSANFRTGFKQERINVNSLREALARR